MTDDDVDEMLREAGLDPDDPALYYPDLSFKYVADFSECSVEVDDEDRRPCAICGMVTAPRWGSGFSSQRDHGPICGSCVANGLPDWLQLRRDGDPDALRRQLRDLHADWSDDQIEADVRAKDHELRRRTPPVLSWQDWSWPACCGDYCRFLHHAGQVELAEFANDRRIASGIELLRQGLTDHIQPAESVWSFLPSKRVSAESNWGTQAYVFECLTCRRLVIEWDAC